MRRLILYILATLVSATSINLMQPTRSSALTGAEFNAGRIMDDEIFFNGNSLTANDIQIFLNSKLSSCDTNGNLPRYGTSGQTRKQWAEANGKPLPPYTCLKDYKQTVTEKVADTYCTNPIAAGEKTAAQIIELVAKACSVNPKVMLVLLQKEQSLLTDDWPWPVQYEKATGFSCPDTAPCDPEFAGFFNQVYYGARQYQRYAKQASIFSYKAGRNNFVQYNPNSACGGKDIYIANQATAGLYNYTPYQPNDAALTNLYGTGDDCSAYGNRNFWRLFTEWFGTTTTDFRWSPEFYQIWNYNETKRLDPGKLLPGEKYIVKVFAYNTGTSTWKNSGPAPVSLGTASPDSRRSQLCSKTWFACDRPGKLLNSAVLPGQGGDFKFTFQAPYKLGEHREDFKPVAEYVSWFDKNHTFGVWINSPGTYSWSASHYTIMNESKTQTVDPGNLRKDTRYFVRLNTTNTGTATWKNSGAIRTNLGLVKPNGAPSVFCDNTTWLSCNRPTKLSETAVEPGASGNFEFYIKTPSEAGNYREDFRPVAELFTWYNPLPITETFGVIVK